MLKKLIAGAVTICMAVSLTACDIPFTKGDSEFPVTAGHTKIKEAVTKVVAVDDSVADILIACGYTDKIAGCSSECTQPEISDVVKMGTKANPDVNAIEKSGATLVFADEEITSQAVDALKEKNITVLRMAPASNEEELKALYSKVCAVFEGNTFGKEKGTQVAEKILSQLEEIKNSLPETTTATKTCYLYDTDGNAVTGDSFGDTIISYAGGIDIAADVTGGKLLFKTIKAENPNYIFCNTGLKDKIAGSDEYKTLNAVKRNKVYEIPSEEMTRQGYTIVTAVKHMSEQMYSATSPENAKSVEQDYDIEITEGMSYTFGEEDSYVMAIQKRLDDLGYLAVEPSGYFGESTAAAVEEFQTNNDLAARDGVADETTLRALFSSSAVERATPAR